MLVIGRDGSELICLQLTSKDHDRDAEDEAKYGRHWMDVGSGDWDRDGRPSEVRLDRLLRMPREERAALGFMHPGRVDVIGAGALVWSRVVRRVAAASGVTEVVASEHDILDGIALGLAAR